MASKGQGATANEEKLLKHAAQQIRKVPPTYKRKNAFVFIGLLSSVIGICILESTVCYVTKLGSFCLILT